MYLMEFIYGIVWWVLINWSLFEDNDKDVWIYLYIYKI